MKHVIGRKFVVEDPVWIQQWEFDKRPEAIEQARKVGQCRVFLYEYFAKDGTDWRMEVIHLKEHT